MKIAAIALMLCAAPALAQGPQPPGPPCLRGFQVREYRQLDNHDLEVTADVGRKYRVRFLDSCPDAGAYSTLVIKTRMAGKLACVGRGDHVLVSNYGGPPDRCTVAGVDYYGPQDPKD